MPQCHLLSEGFTRLFQPSIELLLDHGDAPVLQADLVAVLDSMHYRNPRLCRVLYSLPSAFCRALGKEGFAACRTR
jgi:hypothetical protein